MTDLEFLFLILAAVYLTQCVSWVAPHAKVFTRTVRGRWQAHAPEIELSAWSTKAAVANLLPFSAGVVLAEPEPLPITPQGIVVRVSGAESAAENESPWELLRWEEMTKITAQGDRVRVDGKTAYRAVSAAEAARLVEFLRGVKKLAGGARASAIEKELKRRCDARAAQERYEEYRAASRWPGAFANLLSVLLLVIVPVYIEMGARVIQWLALLITALVTIVLTTLSFRRAHRGLYPDEKDARFSETLTVALSPFAAMRARDALSRNSLAAYDPLTVALTLLRPAAFETEAARVYRDMHFPVPLAQPPPAEVGKELEWFRDLRNRVLATFIKKHCANPAQFLEAPPRSSPASATYCPRCHAQFRMESGICSDCRGVNLLAFAAGETVSPERV